MPMAVHLGTQWSGDRRARPPRSQTDRLGETFKHTISSARDKRARVDSARMPSSPKERVEQEWTQSVAAAKASAPYRGGETTTMTQNRGSLTPTAQIRHSEAEGWRVAARWPDGHVEDIAGFKSELEANDWIADHFQEWLEIRKNNDQHSARQPGGC
jgi:hypothetical protein